MILNPGFDLTLRPMKYPEFYEMYKDAIKNTWTVEEVDFSNDIVDLNKKLTPAERFLISRLVAFFATGDSIVGNNLVLNLYKHVNSPEARLYLSRQLFEEALHVQFYLTLLDTYIPDMAERERLLPPFTTFPLSRKRLSTPLSGWIPSMNFTLNTVEERRKFLMNMICFAGTIEGLFFFGAFAYVYFLRSKGLLNGLATGTNWVFRDESGHIDFAFKVIETAVKEEPALFDQRMKDMVIVMMKDAIDCEMTFANDILEHGVAGLSARDMRTYLEYIADQRLERLGIPHQFGRKNPFDFMALQDTQELTNFFERRVSAYQVGVTGAVSFDESF